MRPEKPDDAGGRTHGMRHQADIQPAAGAAMSVSNARDS